MKLQIEIDLKKVMGAAKEIDLAKLLEIYQRLNKGEDIIWLDGQLKVRAIKGKQ